MIHCLTDLFPLQFLGFNGVCPIGVGWYLSVLLFVSFVFYPILLKYKDKYVLYFAPIITLLTLGYICYTSGSICVNAEWNGYVFLGMLRGIGVMNLGFICYCLTEKLKKKDFSVLKNSLLTFVECFGYLSAVLYAFFYEIYDSTSFYILALLAVSVIISFSNKSYLQKVFNPKICSFLGGWSFSIYITHFYITRKVDVWFWESSVIQKFVICWIIILIVSLYVHIIGTMISKLISRKQVKKQIKL